MNVLKKATLLTILFFTTFCVNAEILSVTLLGTGTPRPSIERFGSATLVKYKNVRYLFDVGRGATIRLNQLGLNPSDIDHLFLTHLHSDHITGYADFWLTGWIWQRREPLNVYGPDGSADFVKNIYAAYSKDIEYRQAQTNLPVHSLEPNTKDISEGIVFNNNNVRITAFSVDQGKVEYALGYKLEAGKHSVVISGDTTFSRNIIKHAKKTDLLIHELAVIRPDLLKQNNRLKQIFSYHTSVEKLKILVNKLRPKQTVLNHLLLIGEDQDSLESKLESMYGNRVIIGEDLMSIEINDATICINGDCRYSNEKNN